MASVAGPPSDFDLLGVPRVTHDEFVGGRLGRQAGEQAHRQVERAPPRVDRCGPPAVGGAQHGQDQRRAGCRREIGGDMGGIVGRVLIVFVQRGGPRRLLRPGINLHLSRQSADRRQHIAGHLPHRPVRRESDAVHSSVAVLCDCFVGVQVQRDDQRTRAVRCRQWKRLPAACGQAQRGVLQLGFGRSQRRGQLAQNLRVGVKGVAGGAPGLVGERRPFSGHRRKLPLNSTFRSGRRLRSRTCAVPAHPRSRYLRRPHPGRGGPAAVTCSDDQERGRAKN